MPSQAQALCHTGVSMRRGVSMPEFHTLETFTQLVLGRV